jgi:hypothetical protein
VVAGPLALRRYPGRRTTDLLTWSSNDRTIDTRPRGSSSCDQGSFESAYHCHATSLSIAAITRVLTPASIISASRKRLSGLGLGGVSEHPPLQEGVFADLQCHENRWIRAELVVEKPSVALRWTAARNTVRIADASSGASNSAGTVCGSFSMPVERWPTTPFLAIRSL